jgi:RNA polymerase sigma-70 factor (ECF subfamily)
MCGSSAAVRGFEEVAADAASCFFPGGEVVRVNCSGSMSARVLTIERTNELHDRVTALYEESRDDVYYYAQTLGLSPAQAQEVTQEVFLRLYVSLRDGEEIQNMRGWVFRVAHNFGLKMRAKEREHRAIDDLVERSPSRENSPEEQLIVGERQTRMQAALAELSPQQRQCLHLRAAGLRYREIGEAIGIGTSTVNEFIRRAVSRLRRALHE